MSTPPNPTSLTTADVNREISNAPAGTMLALPDMTRIGITDVPRAVQNYLEGAERSKHALSQGCFIEVINLRVQHSELWLRLLLVHSRGSGFVIPAGDKRTFGQVIEDCKSLLPIDLYERLRLFNTVRIEAVHKYLLGATDYGALSQACTDFQGLDRKIYNFVVKTVGRPVTSAQGRAGEIIVQLRA